MPSTINDGRLTNTETAISRNSGNITTNTAAISSNNDAINTLDSAVTALGETVGNNSTGISDNVSAITANSNDISTHGTAISGIDTRVTANRGDIDDHEGRITVLEGAGSSRSNELWGDLGRLLSGAVTVTAGEILVLGTGTFFTEELNVGDAISIGGEVHSVGLINNDGELELDAPHINGAFEVTAYTDNDLLLLKSGATNEKFAVDKSGHFFRKVERASELGPGDDTDDGQIVTRVLTINKSRTDTALRIGYTDNFRAMNGSYPACRWEVRVDDLPCPGGALIYDVYNGGATVPTHISNHVVGYCEGIAAGSHEIQVWVGPVGSNAAGDCYTGWSSSRWTIEVEEVY